MQRNWIPRSRLHTSALVYALTKLEAEDKGNVAHCPKIQAEGVERVCTNCHTTSLAGSRDFSMAEHFLRMNFSSQARLQLKGAPIPKVVTLTPLPHHHLTSKSQVLSIHFARLVGAFHFSFGVAFSASKICSGAASLYFMANSVISLMRSKTSLYWLDVKRSILYISGM
jgi:hypothetical protein